MRKIGSVLEEAYARFVCIAPVRNKGGHAKPRLATYHDNGDAVEEELHRAVVIDLAERKPPVLNQPPAVG